MKGTVCRTRIYILLAAGFLVPSMLTGAMPLGHRTAGSKNEGIVQSGQSSSQPPANGAGTTEPTPDSEGIYRIGHGVQPPRVLQAVDPDFTALARKKKITGYCVVALVVDAEGNPQNVHVFKSIGTDLDPKLRKAAEGLDQNAIKAVTQYRFKPAEYQGKPVPVRVDVEVNFQVY